MAVRVNFFGQKSIYQGSELIVSDAPIVAKTSYHDVFQLEAAIPAVNGNLALVSSLERITLVSPVNEGSARLIEIENDTTFVRQHKGINKSVLVLFSIDLSLSADAVGNRARTLQVNVDGVTFFEETIELPAIKPAFLKSVTGTLALKNGAAITIQLITTGSAVGSTLDGATVKFLTL